VLRVLWQCSIPACCVPWKKLASPVKESERFELALYRRIELLEYGIPPEFLARREMRESDRELGSRGHCIDDLSSQTDTKRMDEHWGEQQSG
jgi:hypothetical protein